MLEKIKEWNFFISISVTILVIILGIVAANMFLLQIGKVDKEISALDTQYKQLEVKNKDKQKLQADLDTNNKLYQSLLQTLPPDLLQENNIMEIMDLKNETGLEINSMAFSDVALQIAPKPTGSPAPSPTPSPTPAKDANAKTDNSAVQAAANKTAADPNDKVGIYQKVNLGFTGDYNSLKSFLSQIGNSKYKVAVNNISIAMNKENKLVGTITINFYGFRDKSAKPQAWDAAVQRGTNDFFAAPTK